MTDHPRPPLIFEIPTQASIVKCRGCDASVVWIFTANGKRMPLDATGPTRGQSHFATCPKAVQFRKPKA